MSRISRLYIKEGTVVVNVTMPKKKKPPKPGQNTAKGDKAPRAADPRVQLSAESEARVREMLKTVSVQVCASACDFWITNSGSWIC